MASQLRSKWITSEPNGEDCRGVIYAVDEDGPRQASLAVRRFFLLAKKGAMRLRRMSSVAYTLCSNQPTYLPKFVNFYFSEDMTPDATLKNVILRF